jgi:hypothetical protein
LRNFGVLPDNAHPVGQGIFPVGNRSG